MATIGTGQMALVRRDRTNAGPTHSGFAFPRIRFGPVGRVRVEEGAPTKIRTRPVGRVRVEVGGIEPPSYEISAPASPSAASSEFSDQGTLPASFPRP